MSHVVEKLINTSSCYVGFFDSEAPFFSRRDFFKPLIARCRLAALADGQEWAALYYLNDSLMNTYPPLGLLSWMLLFDGVFKVRIEVLPDILTVPEPLPPKLTLTSTEGVQILSCTSGSLYIADLSAIGVETLTSTIIVYPGLYYFRLTRNIIEEARHEFLEKPDQYPAGDGPDWIIQLQRCEWWRAELDQQ